jgi:hypothetical protein
VRRGFAVLERSTPASLDALRWELEATMSHKRARRVYLAVLEREARRTAPAAVADAQSELCAELRWAWQAYEARQREALGSYGREPDALRDGR